MDDVRFSQEVIALSEEARQFLSSSLGKYIAGRAELEKDRARDQLLCVSPDNAKAIADIQMRFKRYDDFALWLREIIDRGNIEYEAYISQEEGVED